MTVAYDDNFYIEEINCFECDKTIIHTKLYDQGLNEYFCNTDCREKFFNDRDKANII